MLVSRWRCASASICSGDSLRRLDEDDEPVGAEPAGQARALAHQRAAARRRRRQADHHAAARAGGRALLGRPDRAGDDRPRARALDALGHLAQRELAQVGEVLLLEEVLQRPGDLVGARRSCPARRRSCRSSTARSRLTTWSACLRKLSGTVSRTATPVARSTTSFRLSRCWTLKRADDVDAGVEQLDDVLVALLVVAAGHVGVRELVDERQRRIARAGCC